VLLSSCSEALEVAGRLEDEVRSIEIDISQGVGELPGVAEFGATPDEAEGIATAILEEGEDNDRAVADRLKSCGTHVGTGKWITYGRGPYEEKFYQTSVCYLSYKYKRFFGRLIIEYGAFVETCRNNHILGEQAWACPGRGVWEF
jgi:hypothetical protein